ncbi:TIGR04283 family arsenosugar biosynthesis glycosyltransferase [Flavobacteriaceae bacterium F89]|uniref:TIGR04283 family arsenosugar biosynthesis glycosyltransferase n=1 Tax=Cerina litoralis TaxID=2874477 RepID=A0AAE3EUY8_9FLAO|nr:TIGR04283 family arsenosugar biosynthesis glycosyltransferase [Cerina litoralis]MCG2460773.1 TIGR04283 family arsenosugar biosynthesis glycosyltransferase [Cerina litoralis]
MVSIIIPAHNERHNLTKLLGYLEQVCLGYPFEIIISLSATNKDNSKMIPVSDNVHFLECDKKSRAIQMNQGTARAKGDILVFLHADVIPPSTFMEDIIRALTAGEEAGFFSYRFDSDNFFLKINSFFTGLDTIFTGGGDQCLFIRRKVFDKLGGFKENQSVMEDFEFFGRMKKNGVRYKIIKNNLLVSARKYENNSYVRVNLSNLLLVILFKFGCSSEKLKNLHDKLIHVPNRIN